MKTTHRSIDNIVEDQVRTWQMRSRDKAVGLPPPGLTVTVSCEPGSAGSVVASMAASELKYDFFDRELIHKTAESSKMSEAMIESLDEKQHKLVHDWISAFFTDKHPWGDQYFVHLVNVLLTISRHGSAVIVGRGAAFVLPPEHTLRVRIVAPLELRIKNLIGEFGLSETEARERILKGEADRVKFIKQYFRAELTDPNNYDLLINSGRTGLRGAVEIVKAAASYFGKS
jgi:cytidylate kinase